MGVALNSFLLSLSRVLPVSLFVTNYEVGKNNELEKKIVTSKTFLSKDFVAPVIFFLKSHEVLKINCGDSFGTRDKSVETIFFKLILAQCYIYIPPENVRKPLVF